MNVLHAQIVTLATVVCLASCNYDTVHDVGTLDVELREKVEYASPTGSLEHFTLPSSTDYDNIPQDPNNPLSAEKIALGKFLFFETGMGQKAVRESGMQTYSCATCHIPSAGFKPGSSQGIADGGIGFGVNGEMRQMNPEYHESEIDAQGARALSLLNVAYVTNTFWNGQFGSGFINEGTEALWNEEDGTYVNEFDFEAIEAQNIEGMRAHRLEMTEELADNMGYKVLFDLAFDDAPVEDRYSTLNASLAISAYIRSLLPHRAPFQDWLKGDTEAMTVEEKRGAVLFFSKARCYTCHNNTGLNSMEFHALGVLDMYQTGGLNTSESDRRNLGRGGFTKNSVDMYRFKVPQLYNLDDAPFFFHGSSKETLEEVVEYFDAGAPENPNVPLSQISSKFRPLNLTDTEKADLLSFLKTGLRDPYLNRFQPPYIRSGNCFPNNDSLSVEQMGCE